jgi:diguanylate cyclase (GGDEF)-like protein
MKLFLDRNKSLLPRIDVIFLLTRIMTFASICWFGLFGEYGADESTLFIVIVATYGVMVILFMAGMRGRFDLKLAYLGSIIYDVVFLPLLIVYTGGVDSSFFLFFYVTISVAAYILSFPYALTLTVALSAAYVGVVAFELQPDHLFDFSMRLGFMWVYFLALTYVSEYMHKSERRLMKLFNTLNLRTSELEKSQAQLEMIYENTRVLAAIREPDKVVQEIMRLMNSTLGYSNCAIVQKNAGGEFYHRARCIDSHMNYHIRPLKVSPEDLIYKVSRSQEEIRIKDVGSRRDYHSLNKKTRSAMLVPMTFHGHSTGLLVAESSDADFFRERDEQLLLVVARSAGLALENAELIKRTEELSIIDELTESYNYRYFIQKFQEEKKRAVRYNLPLSIIMIDIDWFKKLNDGYGHEAGNSVLRELSKVIKSCIRDVDIFARYGGEEFVVILPQTAQAEALHIGERIRDQVEQKVIDTGQTGAVRVTVSVGVSSFPENGHSEEELVSVADQALYKAKGAGKNLVCVS